MSVTTLLSCMHWSEWNTTLTEEDNPLLGSASLKWECENEEKDVQKTVTTKLKKRKTYPEENFEFEGEINGKSVQGTFVTGHGPVKSVRCVDGGKKLSDAERMAGISHIDWLC